MTAKSITPTLSVCKQVLPSEVANLAAAGFRSIVCNPPDGEGADQPLPGIITATKPAGYDMSGVVLPLFPNWLIDGTKPSHLARLLKQQLLPPIFWKAMLRGREWMAKPQPVTVS